MSYHPYSSITLADLLDEEEESSRWDHNDQVVERYRDILRDIVDQLSYFEFHQEHSGGMYAILDPDTIRIYGNRSILPAGYQYQDYRSQLGDLVSTVLGYNSDSRELHHFYRVLTPSLDLKYLRHHALFLSPRERLNFPLIVVPRIQMQLGYGWREIYKQYMGQTSIGMEELINDSDHQLLRDVYNYGSSSYEDDDDLAVVDFSVNIANHAADYYSTLDVEELESELTSIFPDRLINLFDFCVQKRIDLSYFAN